MKKDKNFILKQRRDLARSGYSFLEMIITVSILIILVLAAVVIFVDMRKKARDTQEKAIIAIMQTAINNYYSKYFVWPAQNPFTLMTYPPPYNADDWSDCKEKWGTMLGSDCGTCGGSAWSIFCPHYSPFDCPSKGFSWCYCLTGTQAGKISPMTSLGH